MSVLSAATHLPFITHVVVSFNVVCSRYERLTYYYRSSRTRTAASPLLSIVGVSRLDAFRDTLRVSGGLSIGSSYRASVFSSWSSLVVFTTYMLLYFGISWISFTA